MNASKDLGGVPGAADITRQALAARFDPGSVAAPPSTGVPPATDDPRPTGDHPPTEDPASTGDHPPVRTRPPARERTAGAKKAVGGAVAARDGRTGAPAEDDADSMVWPSGGALRALEMTARSYAKGWVRVEPRAARLVEAVEAALGEGVAASQVRGFLAQFGVTPDSIPARVAEALQRR